MKLKFNPTDWSKINGQEWQNIPQGRLQLQLNQDAEIWVEGDGVEVLAAFASKIDITGSSLTRFRVAGSKSLIGYIRTPVKLPITSKGKEVFTNADRRPAESGTMLAVKTALRELKLEEYRIKREMAQAAKEGRKTEAARVLKVKEDEQKAADAKQAEKDAKEIEKAEKASEKSE